MKKITLLTLVMFILSYMPCFAQRAPSANLTIFSEDGSKFFLELNGERYNDVALTNVRVEELPNPYYSCKIIFAEPAKGELVKKNLTLDDIDGVMQDVTYRIKTINQTKRTLSFYSAIPAEQNMVRPANCPVYRYGQPNKMVVDARGITVTEQVTVQQTTTASTGLPAAAGVNMNVGGVQLSVTVPAPGIAMTTTSTTTTTTTTGGAIQQTGGQWTSGADHDDRGGCRNAMAGADFEQAKATITGTNFDDTRLALAKQVIESNCLNATQVMAVMKLFSFEESRLNFAKHAYGYCTDKNNYFKVVNAFTFDDSKNELNDYIKGQK